MSFLRAGTDFPGSFFPLSSAPFPPCPAPRAPAVAQDPPGGSGVQDTMLFGLSGSEGSPQSPPAPGEEAPERLPGRMRGGAGTPGPPRRFSRARGFPASLENPGSSWGGGKRIVIIIIIPPRLRVIPSLLDPAAGLVPAARGRTATTAAWGSLQLWRGFPGAGPTTIPGPAASCLGQLPPRGTGRAGQGCAAPRFSTRFCLALSRAPSRLPAASGPGRICSPTALLPSLESSEQPQEASGQLPQQPPRPPNCYFCLPRL